MYVIIHNQYVYMFNICNLYVYYEGLIYVQIYWNIGMNMVLKYTND